MAANEARGLDPRPAGRPARGLPPSASLARRARPADAPTPGALYPKGVIRRPLVLATDWDLHGPPPVRLLPALLRRIRAPAVPQRAARAKLGGELPPSSGQPIAGPVLGPASARPRSSQAAARPDAPCVGRPAAAGHLQAVAPPPWLDRRGIEGVQLPPWCRRANRVHAPPLDGLTADADNLRAIAATGSSRCSPSSSPRRDPHRMFPFGRHAFRYELWSLLEAAARARPRPWRYLCARCATCWCASRTGRLRLDARPGARLFRSYPGAIPIHSWCRSRSRSPTPERWASVWSRPATWSSPKHRPGGAAARCWSPPAAGGWRRALLEAALAARPLSSLRARPWRLIAGGNVAADAIVSLGAAPKGCGSGTAARRFLRLFSQTPSLRLPSRVQHCARGAAFPKAVGPGTLRDGNGNGTKNARGASGEPGPRGSRVGERVDATEARRRDRPGVARPARRQTGLGAGWRGADRRSGGRARDGAAPGPWPSPEIAR